MTQGQQRPRSELDFSSIRAMDGGTGSPSASHAASASASPASMEHAEMAEMYGNLHEPLGIMTGRLDISISLYNI